MNITGGLEWTWWKIVPHDNVSGRHEQVENEENEWVW